MTALQIPADEGEDEGACYAQVLLYLSRGILKTEGL